MSWLPSFLSPWTATIAAGLAVPSLLLLYFLKLRRRECEVSSTLLWKKTIQDLQVNAPFQKLRRNLLLLLQMLLLCLLLLALARPVFNARRAAGKVSVILIDRSASMAAADVEGRTRLQEAKRQARELVDTMDRDASAMVIAFDATAEPVQAFTSDKTRLKLAIDRIGQTDRLSQLDRAYALAEMQSLAHDAEQRRPDGQIKPPDIYLYSDGRVSDSSKLALRGGAQLHYQRIGNPESRNIALVSLSAKRRYEQPAEVTVFARFANYGPEPAENVGVMLSVDGEVQRVDQKLLLLPERWNDDQRRKWAAESGNDPRPSVEFNLVLITGATLKVEHTAIEGDALPADDAAQIIVPPPRRLGAMVVTADNYFLQRAIDSMDLQNKALIKPAQYEQDIQQPGKLAQYDLIIFDRHWPKQLPPAGNFIYFGCLPPGTRLRAAMDAGQRLVLKDVGVLDWQREHAIVRNLNLQRLYIGEMLRIEREPENQPVPTTRTETLVEGTLGPLVVLHTEAGRAHLVVSFDLLQSNWPLRPSFPAFLSNAMRYMALGADLDLKQSLQPGATPTLPRHNLRQAGIDKTLKISGPIDRSVSVPDQGDFALPPLDRVGLYQTEPAVPQFEKIAVNLLDDNESNILPVDIAPGTTDEKAENLGQTAAARTEVWWWILACLAAPLCLVEWWVYTRRVHL